MGYALLIKGILILKQTSLSSPVDDFSILIQKGGVLWTKCGFEPFRPQKCHVLRTKFRFEPSRCAKRRVCRSGQLSILGFHPNPGAARSHRTKSGPAFASRPPDGGRSAMVRRGKEVPQGTAQPDLVEGQAEPKGWSDSGLPLSATVLRATRSCSGPATRACAAGVENGRLVPKGHQG